MNFPVSNKSTAILKGGFIIAILLIVFGNLYLYFQATRILYIYFAIKIPLSIYLIHYFKKQNIQKVELIHNNLIVSYKKLCIEIPVTQIKDISQGINLGFDLKFKMTISYSVILKEKYVFGNTLLFDYKAKHINDSLKEDPVGIKVLKSELQRKV